MSVGIFIMTSKKIFEGRFEGCIKAVSIVCQHHLMPRLFVVVSSHFQPGTTTRVHTCL